MAVKFENETEWQLQTSSRSSRDETLLPNSAIILVSLKK